MREGSEEERVPLISHFSYWSAANCSSTWNQRRPNSPFQFNHSLLLYPRMLRLSTFIVGVVTQDGGDTGRSERAGTLGCVGLRGNAWYISECPRESLPVAGSFACPLPSGRGCGWLRPKSPVSRTHQWRLIHPQVAVQLPLRHKIAIAVPLQAFGLDIALDNVLAQGVLHDLVLA